MFETFHVGLFLQGRTSRRRHGPTWQRWRSQIAKQYNAGEHSHEVTGDQEREATRAGKVSEFGLFSSGKVPLLVRYRLGTQVVDMKHVKRTFRSDWLLAG
jgi:hypothetical protein